MKKLPEAEEKTVWGRRESCFAGRKLIESQNYTELQELYLPIYEKVILKRKHRGFRLRFSVDLHGIMDFYVKMNM